ncbi:hypothetical protein P7K49_035384, partial [Saguinus oedipus]
MQKNEKELMTTLKSLRSFQGVTIFIKAPSLHRSFDTHDPNDSSPHIISIGTW